MDWSWVKTFGKSHCSVFFGRIFNIVISDLCYDHDSAYRTGDIALKTKSDFVLAASVWNRSTRADTELQAAAIKAIAVAMGAAVGTAGWLFWAPGAVKVFIDNWIYKNCDPQIL